MIATYTGQITVGSDYTGEFGSIVDLAGLQLTAKFEYDPALGSFHEVISGVGETSEGYGAGSPYLGASLTLEGAIRQSYGSYYGRSAGRSMAPPE